MPQDRYTDRHAADRWDDEYDDDDDDSWDDNYADDDASRAVVAYDESRQLGLPEEDRSLGAPLEYRHEMLIIPGEGLPNYTGLLKRRRRPVMMQLVLVALLTCLMVSALFSVGPLSDLTATATASGGNPFNALANALNIARVDPFVTYRARSGDTFESIAKDFNVATTGIFEANQPLYLTDEVIVAHVYKIPTIPGYGVDYKIPLPPGVNLAGSVYPLLNTAVAGNVCLFCAAAGQTNGPTGLCAPNYQNVTTVAQFNLINPDQPKSGTPKSFWVRGFTPFHSGVDISTGQEGTEVYAAQDGTVFFEALDSGGGGNSIKINHCGGLATSYSHLKSFAVKVGDTVKQGQLIGLQGNTGNSFGAHVHYMLWWKNTPIDPLCSYGTLDGFSQSSHYGGCPPNLQSSAWYRP